MLKRQAYFRSARKKALKQVELKLETKRQFKFDRCAITYLIPCRKIMGAGCVFFFSMDLKSGEQAEWTSLWARTVCPSETRVTSRKSSSSRMSLKALVMFDWKSFQRRQNCSVPEDPMTAGSAFENF